MFVLQDKGFALGNFINCTPALLRLAEKTGQKIDVQFETEYVKQCFIDCPFIRIVDQPTGTPVLSSRLINKIVPDYKFIFERATGETWTEKYHTYVDQFFEKPCYPEYALLINGSGSARKGYTEAKNPGIEMYNLANRLLQEKHMPVIFTGSNSDMENIIGINEGIRFVTDACDLEYGRMEATDLTVASQQGYPLPVNMLRPNAVMLTISSTKYNPTEISDKSEWETINSTSPKGDTPLYWFYDQEERKIELYPTPTSASNTITIRGFKKRYELAASNTTGTASVTAGASAVTSGTLTFTAAMVGQYIQFNDIDYLYEITAFTSANAVTIREEALKTISASASTVGEVIPLPEGFEDLPMYYAMMSYYAIKENAEMKNHYKYLFDEKLKVLKSRNVKTSKPILKQTPFGTSRTPDINNYPLLEAA